MLPIIGIRLVYMTAHLFSIMFFSDHCTICFGSSLKLTRCPDLDTTPIIIAYFHPELFKIVEDIADKVIGSGEEIVHYIMFGL